MKSCKRRETQEEYKTIPANIFQKQVVREDSKEIKFAFWVDKHNKKGTKILLKEVNNRAELELNL